jgi:hypothetical protein
LNQDTKHEYCEVHKTATHLSSSLCGAGLLRTLAFALPLLS